MRNFGNTIPGRFIDASDISFAGFDVSALHTVKNVTEVSLSKC